MSSPSIHQFCSNGHIVKVVAPGFVDSKELFECPICKSHVFTTITSWKDRDEDACIIPHLPIETREVNGKLIKRYDVSGVSSKLWFSTIPDIQVLRDVDGTHEVLTYFCKGHVNKEKFIEYVKKEYDVVIEIENVYYTNFHNQPHQEGGYIVEENEHPGNRYGWYKVTVYHVAWWKNSNYNGDK